MVLLPELSLNRLQFSNLRRLVHARDPGMGMYVVGAGEPTSGSCDDAEGEVQVFSGV